MYRTTLSYLGCNPCEYFCSIGTSVSRWCSDRSQDCDNRDQSCCNMRNFAFLTQTDTLDLSAGGHIPFSGTTVIGEGFQLDAGVLRVELPGVYHLSYTINIPSNADVATTFVVQAGGQDVAGTQQSITHVAGMTSATVSGSAIFEATEQVDIALVSLQALTMTPDVAGDTLATLTIEAL